MQARWAGVFVAAVVWGPGGSAGLLRGMRGEREAVPALEHADVIDGVGVLDLVDQIGSELLDGGGRIDFGHGALLPQRGEFVVLCWCDVAKHWQLKANGCDGVSRAAIELFNLYVNCSKLTKTKTSIIFNFLFLIDVELRVLGGVWGLDKILGESGFGGGT